MPLTKNKPKCLLPVIGNMCLLDYWIRQLRDRISGNILITAHHCHEEIHKFLETEHCEGYCTERIKLVVFEDHLPETGDAIAHILSEGKLLGRNENLLWGEHSGILLINTDTFIPPREIQTYIDESGRTRQDRLVFNIGCSPTVLTPEIEQSTSILIHPLTKRILFYDSGKSFISDFAIIPPHYFWSGIATISSIHRAKESIHIFKGRDISQVFEDSPEALKFAIHVPTAIDMGKTVDNYKYVRELFKGGYYS